MNVSTVIRNNAFRAKFYTARSLMELLDSSQLAFLSDEPLKRWSLPQRQQFIMSVLGGQPQSEMMIDGAEDKWLVISGENELRAIREFCRGEWTLPAQSPDDSSVFGRTTDIEALGMTAQVKIQNYTFSAMIVNPGIPLPNRLWIYYVRLNMAGIDMKVCRKAVFSEDYKWMGQQLMSLGCETEDDDDVWKTLFLAYIFQYDLTPSEFLQNLPLDYYISCFLMEGRKFFDGVMAERPEVRTNLPCWLQIIKESRKKNFSKAMQESLSALLPRYDKCNMGQVSLLEDFRKNWEKIPRQRYYQGQSVGAFLQRTRFLFSKYQIKL